MTDERASPELSSVSEPQWTAARRCFPVIQRLAKTSCRTRAQVLAAAAELGYSRAQVYALLQRFLAEPRLTSLLPRKRGQPHGRSRLSPVLDQLVGEAIETFYLARQRPRLVHLVTEIRQRSRAAGLTPPSRKAITARLRSKPRREIVSRREGHKAARDQYATVIGSLEADWPLSLVQIDHTRVDVIVVDSLTRAAIQRPWLTLAIDVCTRCVLGFHLSL